MDLKHSAEFAVFSEIVRDTRSSGQRVLAKWIANPPEQLKKADPNLYKALEAFSSTDVENLMLLVAFASRTSFFYLFKHLEESDGGISFEMSMKASTSPNWIPLISENEDLQLRDIANS